MKRRLTFIALLVAVCTLAGAAYAGIRVALATVVAFDPSTKTVTASAGEQEIDLHHSSSTEHGEVSDPQGFPPGPCKRLAFKWNMAVHQNESNEVFDGLIAGLATNHCSIVFTTSGVNGDGSHKLVAIAPAK